MAMKKRIKKFFQWLDQSDSTQFIILCIIMMIIALFTSCNIKHHKRFNARIINCFVFEVPIGSDRVRCSDNEIVDLSIVEDTVKISYTNTHLRFLRNRQAESQHRIRNEVNQPAHYFFTNQFNELCFFTLYKDQHGRFAVYIQNVKYKIPCYVISNQKSMRCPKFSLKEEG